MAPYERHDEHHEGLPVLSQILVEMRELRTDFNRESRENAGRFARIETFNETVIGGQQPGRLTIAENRISDLSAWRWRMVGISSMVSVFATGLLGFLWEKIK